MENYYNSCLAGKITTCRIIPGWEILATRVDVVVVVIVVNIVVVVVIVVNIVVVVVAVVIPLLSILIGGFGVAEGKLKIWIIWSFALYLLIPLAMFMAHLQEYELIEEQLSIKSSTLQ